MADFHATLRAALADRYTIERELGRGGMATVYLARDVKHERFVALKVLSPALAVSLGADRFLREITLAARLQHPHIITVFDSGDAGGVLWYTMPYIEGETLRARLERERQLPLEEAVRIASEAARALEYAHQHGVLHRDIKPENLLLTTDGTTLVADFGIARPWNETGGLTETGLVVGTPAYMSPEQAAGERALDARSDVYALGCVLYEMLAGDAPYSGPNAQAILAKRLSEPVPHVSATREVPPAIEQAVSRALARVPADRFATAADFQRALLGTALPRRHAASRAWVGVGAVAILLVIAIASALVVRSRAGSDGAPLGAPASAAVLPFADLSEARDQAYFSDGLTDELITALSHIDGLHVAARTSSFQFKGSQIDLSDVRRRLHVDAVLEGSVRRSGDRLRINAQLVSTRDGYQLWAEAYDRQLKDVFAVQEDIARAIISALRVKLGPGASGALRTRPTADLEAHDLYLKGRFAWNQRTSAGMREAVRYLEQAVARDSGYALAWAALADAYVLVIPYAGTPRDVDWPNARTAAARALALDSALGEAHTALAYGTMIYDWNWAAAESSFRRAITVDPAYPTGHQWYGDFLWSQGRLDEALMQMREAQRLDPLSLVIATELAQTFYLMHRLDTADVLLRGTLALDPNYPHALYIVGLVAVQQHHYRQGIDAMRRALELGGFQEDLAGGLAYAYGAAGDRVNWTRLTGELTRRLQAGTVGPFALALAYTGKGDLTRGFEYLNRAIAVRDAFLPEDFFDPQLDALRRDHRFAAIEQRMQISRRP